MNEESYADVLSRLHPFSIAVTYPFDRFNVRLQPLLKESPNIINVPERNRNADPMKLLHVSASLANKVYIFYTIL